MKIYKVEFCGEEGNGRKWFSCKTKAWKFYNESTKSKDESVDHVTAFENHEMYDFVNVVTDYEEPESLYIPKLTKKILIEILNNQ